MGGLLAIIRGLGALNAGALAVGRWIGIGCMALMVVFILVQVFWRYVLSNPLPWPEEAARFLMLWLMIVAPTALRRGGFVAIDMIQLFVPRLVGGMLTLGLLAISLAVLVVAVGIGWSEVTGFSGNFKTASLNTIVVMERADGFPWIALDWGWQKMPRAQMMASLLVGFALLTSVTVELMLRQVAVLLGLGARLPDIPEASTVGAE